jgi:signal peptide peptidase SppA
MSTHLPLMMQNLFNTPIALSQRKAEMIVAALAGRLDIRSLTTETAAFDQRALFDLSARGRDQARLERELIAAKRAAAPEGPWTCDYWGDRPYRLSETGIAIIEVLGTLTRTWGIDPESGSTGYDGIWTKLAFAMDDASCKGIWVKDNSGGGAVDGLFDLTEAIFKCSARNGGKPIWAFAGDYAYSAAYAIAAACDKVFAPRLGGIGSIGCIAIVADLTGKLEQEGIKAHIFRSADRKAIGIGGLESLDEEETRHIQAQIDEAGDYFQELVAQYRALSKSDVSKTRGTDYTATQAKAIGLIDGILTEQDAWSEFEREIAR